MTKSSSSHNSLLKRGRRILGNLKRRAFGLLHLKQNVRIIEQSGLFDRSWYLKQYPDVAELKMDPISHYLRYGAPEGRDPNPNFSTWGYVETYPDVAVQRTNPFIHYILYGRAEGRELVKKNYSDWIVDYDQLSDEDRAVFRRAIERFESPRLISILMPVYNTNRNHLEAAIRSVIGQSYPNWELCISDDASTDPKVREILEAFAKNDPRIKVAYRKNNGHIAANSNSALELATGDYVAMLDHDDVLAEQVLFWFVHEILKHPDAQILYSDEDKLNAQGRRYDALFKPDWNPAMIMAQNYVSHLTMYRRGLITRAGGFRVGFEGSQDHDLLLRCADLIPATGIRHIPRILYHWRADSGSTASDIGLEAKPYAWEAGARAIQEHLDRRGIAAKVKPVIDQYYQVEYAPSPRPPKVVVVIPTALKMEFVPRCITSVLRETTYPNVEFIVTVNEQHVQTAAQKSFLEKLKADPRVRVHLYDAPSFNYSRTNNRAVESSDAPVICFLNDDVEVITKDWLEKLVARVLLNGVGAVGPILYYPNDRIQHAGVILGIGGVAGHQFHNMPRGNAGYYGRALLEQDLSCVTAACMVMRREVFDSIGGFNEKFAIAFNDVDLCVRVRRLGWRILWTPAVEMYHHESASLGKHNAPQRQALFAEEVKLMRATWGDMLDADPHFNPNLSLATPYYTLAFPPRITKLPPRQDIRVLRKVQQSAEVARPDVRATEHARISFADIWDMPGSTEPELRPTVIIAGLNDDEISSVAAQLCGDAGSKRLNIVSISPSDAPSHENVKVAPVPEHGDLCLHLDELIREASGEFVVLVSSPGRFQRGWLGAFADTFERFDAAGAVCGVVLTENGRVAWSGADIDTDGRILHADHDADPQRYDLASVRHTNLLWPGLIAIRRDTFKRAGGFGAGHASLAAGLVDLSLRLKDNGHHLFVQPFAQSQISSQTDFDAPRLSRQMTARLLISVKPRPRVLLIDRFAPTPDIDSGSNDIYWFMRIFLDLGYEVTFVAAHAPEHAGRYTDELRLLGIICPVAPQVSPREFLEAHARDFDLIFVYRVTVANELIEPLRQWAPDARLVFDTVDLHYLREQRAAELTGSQHALAEAENLKDAELRAIGQADATILLSAYEYDQVGKLVPEALRFLIPIVRPVPGRLAPFEDRRGALFVGGFKHAPNIDAVHFLCGSIWPLVRELLPDASLKIVGADAPDEIMAYHAPSDGVEILGFVADLTDLYRTARLNVAPLRYGAGLKGKVVASLAFGLPCVATPEAAEGMVNGDEAEILVADDPRAFAQAIVKVHSDRELWNRMSDAGVAYAQRNFSIEVTTERLREMLARLDLRCP
jgi:GT2 family glycosyltransferase